MRRSDAGGDTVQHDASDRLLVPVAEAAHRLGVCPRTIAAMIADDRLPAVRIGRRVLIPLSALIALATVAPGCGRLNRPDSKPSSHGSATDDTR